jgi:hypothetical protein
MALALAGRTAPPFSEILNNALVIFHHGDTEKVLSKVYILVLNLSAFCNSARVITSFEASA